MPKDKGDEWKHVTVVTKTTGSGGAGTTADAINAG